MPHQLRRGALAALELERARQAERDKKRKRREEEEEEAKAKSEAADNKKKDDTNETGEVVKAEESSQKHIPNKNDPKAVEAGTHLASAGHDKQRPAAIADHRRPTRPTQQPIVATTMNLSDSSSSDDDDDDDD
jgi:hypothetical protein